MSQHKEMLMAGLQEAIDAGHYRTKGPPRPKDASVERAPAEKREPETVAGKTAPAPPPREGKPGDGLVQQLRAKRLETVGNDIEAKLNERFRGGEKP